MNLFNGFAAMLSFIVMGGLLYLIYPTATTFANSMPSEIKVFTLMSFLGISIMALFGTPLLMIMQGDNN